MDYTPIIFIGMFILYWITRPVTIFFHELGHAIPALLITGKKVSVYFGSFGNQQKCGRFQLGPLEVWFRYNALLWKGGACHYAPEEVSANKQIVITLLGPVSSLIVATASCYLAFTFDGHGALKLFLVIFTVSALFDLFANLKPWKSPQELPDGQVLWSDGQRLKELLFLKTAPPEYEIAVEYYSKQEFAMAAITFENILANGREHEIIIKAAIAAHLHDKNYQKALDIQERFEKKCSMDSNDYSNAGLIKSRLGLYKEALVDYQSSINLNPSNHFSLNNRGYTYNLLNQYELAMADFDKVIELQPLFAYAYNNRGLAKIKLGRPEEGLQDIHYSLELNSENAYAYKHLGIYYLDLGNKEEAHKLFLKAKELDADTHGIDSLIEESGTAFY